MKVSEVSLLCGLAGMFLGERPKRVARSNETTRPKDKATKKRRAANKVAAKSKQRKRR